MLFTPTRFGLTGKPSADVEFRYPLMQFRGGSLPERLRTEEDAMSPARLMVMLLISGAALAVVGSRPAEAMMRRGPASPAPGQALELPGYEDDRIRLNESPPLASALPTPPSSSTAAPNRNYQLRPRAATQAPSSASTASAVPAARSPAAASTAAPAAAASATATTSWMEATKALHDSGPAPVKPLMKASKRAKPAAAAATVMLGAPAGPATTAAPSRPMPAPAATASTSAASTSWSEISRRVDEHPGNAPAKPSKETKPGRATAAAEAPTVAATRTVTTPPGYTQPAVPTVIRSPNAAVAAKAPSTQPPGSGGKR